MSSFMSWKCFWGGERSRALTTRLEVSGRVRDKFWMRCGKCAGCSVPLLLIRVWVGTGGGFR